MYIIGFVDYDGTQVFLTNAGFTEYPEDAKDYESPDYAQAYIDSCERSNFVVYLYDNGSIEAVEVKL